MGSCYIVYAAFDANDVCLYVGEGKPDRWKHIISGTSHCYEANRWHFAGKQIKVNILAEGLTKQAAIDLEKAKIGELKPAWNKAEYGNTNLMFMAGYAVKKLKKAMKSLGGRWCSNKDRDIQIVKDLCKLLNNQGETTISRGQKWNSIKVPDGFMSHLSEPSGKYYAALREVFSVTKLEGSFGYSLKLLGWEDEVKSKMRENNE